MLTQLCCIASDDRPDEPIERSKSFWPACPFGRRTYPGLKFPQRRVCIRSKDPVGPPGVESEFHQSSLQLGDVIADHHVTRNVGEHPITELPARLVESAKGVGPDDAVDGYATFLLERPHRAVECFVERGVGEIRTRGDVITQSEVREPCAHLRDGRPGRTKAEHGPTSTRRGPRAVQPSASHR